MNIPFLPTFDSQNGTTLKAPPKTQAKAISHFARRTRVPKIPEPGHKPEADIGERSTGKLLLFGFTEMQDRPITMNDYDKVLL